MAVHVTSNFWSPKFEKQLTEGEGEAEEKAERGENYVVGGHLVGSLAANEAEKSASAALASSHERAPADFHTPSGPRDVTVVALARYIINRHTRVRSTHGRFLRSAQQRL